MFESLRQSRAWQILLIVTIILLVPLMADISERVSTLHRMHQENGRLTHELEAALAENDLLLAQLEDVNGQAYLEQWARTEARMTLPGDIAFIPLLPEVAKPTFPSFEKRRIRPRPATSVAEQWRRFFLKDASQE